MKPLDHAEKSAQRYGGVSEDYQAVHDLLDISKSVHADMRHRAILHNSLGPFIAEKAFGTYITNADGKKVSVRSIAEDHIIEDMGRIPNASEFMSLIPEEEMFRFARRPGKVVRVD
jgi:hypothetical protein